MNQAAITEWLRKWARRQIGLNILGGTGGLLGGIGILVLIWALCYMVSLFVLGHWLGYHHWAHPLAGLVLIPALFWGNARTSREYLSEYSVCVGTSSETVVNFYLPGVGQVSNVNPLAPGTIHAGTKMITDCLYSGPRVVMAAFRMFGRSSQMRKMDVDACGAVLTVLFAAHRKMPFQDIVNAVSGLDPAAVFPQLHFIDGVIFLSADPAGLTFRKICEQPSFQPSRRASLPDELLSNDPIKSRAVGN